MLVVLMLLGAAGCGAAVVQQTSVGPGTDAKTLQTRPAAGDPGEAPAARPGSLDPVAQQTARAEAKRQAAARLRSGEAPPISPATLQRLAGYRQHLRNAARRDRAMEHTMRTYMLITREVFRRLRGPSATSGGKVGPAAYNPVPAWRFQGRARREFRGLADRAGVIERHLQDLQAAEGRPKPSLSAPGRGGRIALFRQIFTCIRADAWRRAGHGQRWVDRLLKSGEPTFDDAQRVRLYQRELTMMRTSVRCSTLIARRRARD